MWNDIEFWVVSIMLLLKNIWIYQQLQPKRVVLLCISQGPLQMMHFFIYFEGLFLLDGSRSAQLKNNIISTREASETTVSKVKHAHCLIWISYAVCVSLSYKFSGAFLPSCFVTDSAQSTSYQTRCTAVALFLSASFAAFSGFGMRSTLHLHCLGQTGFTALEQCDKYLMCW